MKKLERMEKENFLVEFALNKSNHCSEGMREVIVKLRAIVMSAVMENLQVKDGSCYLF